MPRLFKLKNGVCTALSPTRLKPLGTNVAHLNGNVQQNEWHPSKPGAFVGVSVPGADKWCVIVTDCGKRSR